MSLPLTVFREGLDFLRRAEYGGGIQQVEDAAYDFAKEITRLEDEGDTASMTLTTFNANVAFTATYAGRPEFGVGRLSVATRPAHVMVECFIGDEEVGTLKITQFGPMRDLKEGFTFTRSTYRGERADEQVYSYLATLIRQLAAEGYNNHVGARENPPGLTLSWTDILHYAKMSYNVYKSVDGASQSGSSGEQDQ